LIDQFWVIPTFKPIFLS